MELLRRRWLLAALAVPIGAAAFAALLHTPMARRRVLNVIVRALDDNLGILAHAEQLDFNLFTLEAELSGVTLAIRDVPDQPFLTLDRARVDLPWSVIRGELAFERVEVDRPRVSLTRSEQGDWNLPVREGATAGTRSPVPPIHRLTIRALGIHVDDRAAGLRLDADTLDLQFGSAEAGRLTGTVTLLRPARVRFRGRETTLDRFDARMTVDDQGVTVDSLSLEAPEGRLEADGRVESPWATPQLALSYDGVVDTARLVAMFSPQTPIGGRLALSGRATGPPDGLSVTLDVEGDELRWANIDDIALRASAAYEASALEIQAFSLSIAGGEISGNGRIDVAEPPGRSQLAVGWHDLDPDPLMNSAAPDAPVSVSAALDGELDATWMGIDPRDADATLVLRSRPRQPRRNDQLPVQGTATLVLQRERWALTLDGLSAPGVRMDGLLRGTLSGEEDTLAAGTLYGSVVVDAGDLSALASWAHTAGLVSGDLVDRVAGRALMTARVNGTLGSPVVSGPVDGSSLTWGDVGPMELRGRLMASQERLSLDGLMLRLGENVAEGRFSIGADGGAIDGELTLDIPDSARFAPAFPPALTPDGILSGAVSISGTTGEPRIEASFQGGPLRLGDRWLDRVSARGSLEDAELHIDQLQIQRGNGTLSLTGQYRVDDGTYTARLDGRQLRLRDLVGDNPDALPVQGALSLAFEGSGTLDSPGGAGRVSIDRVVWAQRDLGPVTAQIDLGEGELRATLSLPELHTHVEGVVGLFEDRTFEVTGDVAGLDLSRLLNTQDDIPEVTGTLSATLDATGDGRNWSTVAARLDLRQFEGYIGDAQFSLVNPSTVDYRDDTVRTDAFALSVGGSRLVLDGGLGRTDPGRLDMELVGDLADFVELARVVGADIGAAGDLVMEGSVRAQARASGTFAELDVTADLEVSQATLGFDGHPPVTNLDFRATYGDALLRLTRLRTVWQGAQVTADGRVPVALLVDELPESLLGNGPPSPLSLHVEVDSITPAALSGYLDESTLADLGGEVSATIDLESDELTLHALRGTVTVPHGTITLAGIPLDQRRETRLEIADGQVRVAAFDWGSDEDYVTLGGTVDLGNEGVLDLTVTAELDLRALSAFMATAATEGHALLIANVQGSPDDPAINGTVELTGVGLRMTEPRLVVSDLNGALFLTRDSVQLYEVVGEANGGPLEIIGSLQLTGLQPEGEIVLLARGIAMEVPEGLRTEVDTDLTLSLSADQLALGGTVTILRGAYREPLTLTGGLFAALQEQESVTIVGIEEESPLDAIELNIRVVTAEDIVIDNNYADAAVGVDLRVVGTVGSPGLTGRAALGDGGELRLGNRVYEIETGTIDFVDPTGIEPQLNIAASTRVSGKQITVTIAGLPDALTTSFQSDPPESESDIVSLLLTGRTLDEVSVAPGAAARDQALGLVSGEFLGTAGRSVGLDTVRFEEQVSAGQIRLDSSLVASETDPGTRLTVGKNLSDQVQLVVSQNLRESGLLTWIVEYLPQSNIELRLVLDDENDPSFGFRHAVSLGNPPRRIGVAAAPRRNTQVGAVRFSGELGIPEAELRSRLGLKAGDRFDFYRWQRDRDSLERLYVGRSYLEARIRARRVEETDGTLSVMYEIVRGPQAVLTIEGHELPDDVLERMRDSWTRAVFDGFLLEELHTQAREHLVSDGFLQAEIEAEILARPNGARKEIVLRIAAAPRTALRSVSFDGNERLTTEQLQVFIAQQGVEETVWADPEPLIRSLLGLYQAEGMLEAQVTIGNPRQLYSVR